MIYDAVKAIVLAGFAPRQQELQPGDRVSGSFSTFSYGQIPFELAVVLEVVTDPDDSGWARVDIKLCGRGSSWLGEKYVSDIKWLTRLPQ